jgi:hypothetical protein
MNNPVMVPHYCPEEGTTISVAEGEECNWCGRVGFAAAPGRRKPRAYGFRSLRLRRLTPAPRYRQEIEG